MNHLENPVFGQALIEELARIVQRLPASAFSAEETEKRASLRGATTYHDLQIVESAIRALRTDGVDLMVGLLEVGATLAAQQSRAARRHENFTVKVPKQRASEPSRA